MATESAVPHAIPEASQEKTQGDKLDHVVGSVLDKSTGLAQDPSAKTPDREPAKEPLK